MSKALEILKEPLVSLPKDGGGFIFSYDAKDIQNVIFIIEEAMKSKACEVCKHKPKEGECSYEPCGTCARFFYEHYEPKDIKW